MTYALRTVTVIAAAIGGGIIGYVASALRERYTARRRAHQRIDAAVRRPELRIELVIGDITAEYVDAIVNAAKPSLYGGGGVDGAIHKAGGPAILQACRVLRATVYPDGLPTGRAVATPAGLLHADHVIHTVGPVYDMLDDRSAQLRSCYTESLAAADLVGARTVAFPLISAGVYGWPKKDAVKQAVTALRAARTNVEVARLVFYDEATYRVAQAAIKD